MLAECSFFTDELPGKLSLYPESPRDAELLQQLLSAINGGGRVSVERMGCPAINATFRPRRVSAGQPFADGDYEDA